MPNINFTVPHEGTEPKKELKPRLEFISHENKRTIKPLFIISTVIVAIMVCYAYWASIESIFSFPFAGPNNQVISTSTVAIKQNNNNCNVLIIPIAGRLVTVFDKSINEPQVISTDIVSALDAVRVNNQLKAVILVVDSASGPMVAGDEIDKAIKRLAKPVITVVRTSATGNAYLAISKSKHIFVSEYSAIGSIAVTKTYPSQSKFTAKDKNDLNKLNQVLIKTIATNRKMSIPTATKVAGSQSYLGTEAIKLNLADEIGDIEWARIYVGKLINEPVNQCSTIN